MLSLLHPGTEPRRHGIAALLALLEPLTGAILAALILGDRLGVTGVAGAALLAAAVIRTIGISR